MQDHLPDHDENRSPGQLARERHPDGAAIDASGNVVGYEIGRKYGARLLDVKVMRKHRTKVAGVLLKRTAAIAAKRAQGK